MNCSTFRRSLNEAESGAPLSAEAEAHAIACGSCQMEWRIQQNVTRVLETESAPQLSAQFTHAVMAKLPTFAPAKAQRNYESVLLITLIIAGLTTIWFASEGLRQSVLALRTESSWLAVLAHEVLAATVWKWRDALTNILGEQILQQTFQVLLISLVTAVVAKGAVVLDDRLRKMLRRL